MGRSRIFTPEQEDAICKRFEAHEAVLQIAADLFCSPKAIYHILHNHGIKVDHRWRGPCNIERNGRMVEMKRRGVSVVAIGQRFGLTADAVYTVLRDWRLRHAV